MLSSAMTLLAPRDVFADAKDTLSSWDKCMEKSYCKSVALLPSPTCPLAHPA
jgi:hypothetical protein